METDAPNDTACICCKGAGQVTTDVGPTVCPDCGGAGHLSEQRARVECRARDIERAVSAGIQPVRADVRWLLSELRMARKALNEVVALAHDAADPDGISLKIRIVAGRALGL
jgi:hypothetical protein